MRYLLLLLALSTFLGGNQDLDLDKHFQSFKKQMQLVKEYQIGKKDESRPQDARKLLLATSSTDFYRQVDDYKYILTSYYTDYFKNK